MWLEGRVMESEVDRWTLAVGQGLFHYEEIRLSGESRPITIIYDAGTFNKSGHHTVAGTSVNLVIQRLRKYSRSCLDYLVLSHYHLDHFSLINKIVTHIRVNHFIAPLLTPDENFFEILSTVISWREADDELLRAVEVVDLAQGFLSEGTKGFVHSLFKNHDDNYYYYDKYYSKKPSTISEQEEPPVHHNEPEYLFITKENGTIDYDNTLFHEFSDQNNDSLESPETSDATLASDTTPIVIREAPHQMEVWTLAFYYYKRNTNNTKLTLQDYSKIEEDINNIEKNSNNNSATSFKEVIDNFLYTTLQIPKHPKKAKDKKLKEIFGDSDMNMTSLCMYSGPYHFVSFIVSKTLNDVKVEYDVHDHARYDKVRYRNDNFFNLSKLVSTYRGSSFKMPNGERNSSLRIKLKETEQSKELREEKLKYIYDSCKHYIPDMEKRNYARGSHWAWLGLGDINFSKKVASDFISHFDKLLDYVGCCIAPHHGSYNGFQTSAVPKKLSSAICIISCDPYFKNYGHPHSQALQSIIESGMIPIIVDKRIGATFHESLVWY